MSTAAKAQAERKTFGQLSKRVAMRRQSSRRAKLVSILWRFLYPRRGLLEQSPTG
jgi:hypothetical protein